MDRKQGFSLENTLLNLKGKMGALLKNDKMVEESFKSLLNNGYEIKQSDIDTLKNKEWFLCIYIKNVSDELINNPQNLDCLLNSIKYDYQNFEEKFINKKIIITEDLIDGLIDNEHFISLIVNNISQFDLLNENNYALLFKVIKKYYDIGKKLSSTELNNLDIDFIKKCVENNLDIDLSEYDDYVLLYNDESLRPILLKKMNIDKFCELILKGELVIKDDINNVLDIVNTSDINDNTKSDIINKLVLNITKEELVKIIASNPVFDTRLIDNPSLLSKLLIQQVLTLDDLNNIQEKCIEQQKQIKINNVNGVINELSGYYDEIYKYIYIDLFDDETLRESQKYLLYNPIKNPDNIQRFYDNNEYFKNYIKKTLQNDFSKINTLNLPDNIIKEVLDESSLKEAIEKGYQLSVETPQLIKEDRKILKLFIEKNPSIIDKLYEFNITLDLSNKEDIELIKSAIEGGYQLSDKTPKQIKDDRRILKLLIKNNPSIINDFEKYNITLDLSNKEDIDLIESAIERGYELSAKTPQQIKDDRRILKLFVEKNPSIINDFEKYNITLDSENKEENKEDIELLKRFIVAGYRSAELYKKIKNNKELLKIFLEKNLEKNPSLINEEEIQKLIKDNPKFFVSLIEKISIHSKRYGIYEKLNDEVFNNNLDLLKIILNTRMSMDINKNYDNILNILKKIHVLRENPRFIREILQFEFDNKIHSCSFINYLETYDDSLKEFLDTEIEDSFTGKKEKILNHFIPLLTKDCVLLKEKDFWNSVKMINKAAAFNSGDVQYITGDLVLACLLENINIDYSKLNQQQVINNYNTYYSDKPEIIKYIDFCRINGNVLSSRIKKVSDIKSYFSSSGVDPKLIEEALFDENLFFIIKKNNMSIDPKYKAYVDFIDANGFILGDIISNPNEITSYFDPDYPKKSLFDYVLLSRNELSNRLFNILFKSGNYDYETIYGNDKYIISYISFCLTYNYKENFEISELKDLKDYFTDTGPTIELLLKLLYSSELYSKFLNGNNMLLHRLKTETNHTIEKYIEFIETNGAIFFKENSYFNEDKINQWFDPKNGFKYDDLSKDVYLAKIIVENIKEKDWKSKITNPDTLYVLELLENYKILFNKLSFEHSDKIQQVFSKDYFEQLKKLGLLTNDIENKQIDQVKYYTDFILDNVSSCEMLKSINDENDLFNFKINREVFDTIINNKINSNDIKKVQKIIDKIYLMHTGITYELRKLLKEDNFSKLINLSSEDFEIKPGQPGQPGHKISNFDYFKFNDVVKYNLYKEDLKYYIDIFKNEESIQLFNNLYLCLKNNVSDTLNEGTNFIFKLAAAIGKQEELFEEIAFKLNDKSITDKDRDIIIFNALRVIYGKDTLNKIDDFSKLTTIGDIETKMEPNKLLYGGDLKYYKNLIIKYLIDFNNGNNLELKEYDKFQDNNIDIDTINLIKLKIETKLKMIYSKDFSSIDHEYANYLEDSLHRAELLLFYIESIMKAVNSIDNVDDFKKLIDEIKENEEKFLPIRMYSISLNENIRQLYELDAQLSLTKISDVIEEVNSNEKTKEKVLKHSETLDCDYYDLSTYEYTIFSHINSDLESLFNPDYFKNSQLCTSQYSDRGAEGEYGHSSGFTYGFDSIPIGGFIVSSTSNSSSNDYFHNNIDYSSFIQQDSIMQREIKESSSLVASSKWGEVDTIRGNMYPTCIIISGDEPTYEEVKEAQELARLLSKYGIIKYESGMAPLVKLQKRGTKKLEQDLNVFDFSIYKYMTETLYTTDGSLSNIKWTDKEKEIIHYISKIAKTLYASNKNSTIDKPFTNSSDSEKKDNPNNNAISETVKFESETYINSNNFERKKTRLEKLKEALETYKSLLNEQELDKMKFIRNVTKRTKTSHTLYKGKMNEKEYYIKPALDGSLDAPWRAGAMSVGFNMQKLINPTTKIDVIIKALDYLGTGNKIMCSLIEEKKNTKDLSIFDGDLENYLPNLSETQLIDILKEHIVDHLLFNYDTKGANFIYDKKHVYGIDKEQALKSCLDNIRGGEGIDPSRKSGDGNAFYQIIFENYKDILSPDTIKKVYEDIIEKVESKSLKEFLDLYEPYLKVIERKDLNRYIERIMGRRLRLVQEIKDFVFDKFNVELEYSEKDLSSELAELNVYLKNAGLNEINVNVSKTK